MSIRTVASVLTADVANGGTFTLGYPADQVNQGSRGPFSQGVAPKISFIDGALTLNSPADFTCSYGNTTVTITYNGATTLKAGWAFIFQFDVPGTDFESLLKLAPVPRALPMTPVRLTLGAPIVASATNICAAQTPAGAVALTLTAGAIAKTVPDVPRSWQIVSSSASDAAVVITGTFLDEYGVKFTEALTTNGTTPVLGKKAFKSIVSIASSAATVGTISVGTSNVLGLPVYLPNAVNIIKELQDGASATAGTTVAGLSPNTKSTSTTADVRGNYTPNATPDGSKVFELVCLLSDPLHLGNPQA